MISSRVARKGNVHDDKDTSEIQEEGSGVSPESLSMKRSIDGPFRIIIIVARG